MASIEQPPSDTDRTLASYLMRTFNSLNISLGNSNQIPAYVELPKKPVIGKIYYFKGDMGGGVDSEGYWGYKSTGWVKIG